MGGGKQAPETAYESDQMLNLRQKWSQSSCDKYVHRIKGTPNWRNKGRYDDNVKSNRKYQ
jgi:hypothetical protein